MINPHARIIDRCMKDAVGIGLRSPDIIVNRLHERLTLGIQFEDRDDLAWFWIFDQILILKTPVRSDIGTKTFSSVSDVAAWTRPYIENPNFQYVAWLC